MTKGDVKNEKNKITIFLLKKEKQVKERYS
jgi:hypothetical protein